MSKMSVCMSFFLKNDIFYNPHKQPYWFQLKLKLNLWYAMWQKPKESDVLTRSSLENSLSVFIIYIF